MLTITSSSATCEIVAVKVRDDPAFSAILVADVARVTGALSFSVIVMVTDCVPSSAASAPETPSIATIPVSFPSQTLSSVGVNDAVPVVAPAEMVISEIVPQSVPSVPVPLVEIVTNIFICNNRTCCGKCQEEPAFSAIELAEGYVTVGALSFSVIVIVTDCVPSSVAEPLETGILQQYQFHYPHKHYHPLV